MIAGYVHKKRMTPIFFNGSCNTHLFENWVEQCLIKELKQEQVVVMDHSIFHNSKKNQQLIASLLCIIILLPPCSPDLNPIEKFWYNMKRWIKLKIQKFDHIFDSFVFFFKYAILT